MSTETHPYFYANTEKSFLSFISITQKSSELTEHQVSFPGLQIRRIIMTDIVDILDDILCVQISDARLITTHTTRSLWTCEKKGGGGC